MVHLKLVFHVETRSTPDQSLRMVVEKQQTVMEFSDEHLTMIARLPILRAALAAIDKDADLKAWLVAFSDVRTAEGIVHEYLSACGEMIGRSLRPHIETYLLERAMGIVG